MCNTAETRANTTYSPMIARAGLRNVHTDKPNECRSGAATWFEFVLGRVAAPTPAKHFHDTSGQLRLLHVRRCLPAYRPSWSTNPTGAM